jgi:predicted TIM-barrel fold metal-dependent hydrolase
MGMVRGFPIISADSHLQIAAERWTDRVPARYRHLAPHTVRLEDGTDATVMADGKPQIFHGGLTGMPFENRTPRLGQFDVAAGVGSPEQRLREQDVDGVDGEIIYTFPTGTSYYRGIKAKDPDAYRSVIHAWNEFLAEEYCAVDRNRLVGMGLMPDTGVDDAIAEMEYCARAGLKGVCLTRYPSTEEIPTPEDDRFWAASLDLGMPIASHVCFVGSNSGRPPFPLQEDWKEVAADVDPFSKFSQYSVRGAGNALQMIFDGLFDRFPKLQIYFAETMVGWLPHFLETLDDQYDRHIHWSTRILGVRKLDRMPSEYVREHFRWGFMHNPVGVRMRHEIGVDRMMWGSDFPHAESNWPESQKSIDEVFAGVPEDECARMLGGTAIEYFKLDRAAFERRAGSAMAAAGS